MSIGVAMVLLYGCVESGPWDGLFEVEQYETGGEGCADAASETEPEAPMVSVTFGSDPYGNSRVQVHLCDDDGQCDEIPRWNGVVQRSTERRLSSANSEILAVERDGGAVCTLAWSSLDLERAGRVLTMDARAWSVNIEAEASGACEAEMEILQDAGIPCEGYWALSARALD